MPELLLYALDLLRGLGMSVACFALFLVGGVALTPPQAGRVALAGPVAAPAIVGAGVYVTLGWFGVAFEIPLTTVITAYAGLVVTLVALRLDRIRAALREAVAGWKGTLGAVATFGAFYVLAYVFFTPSVTGEHLPLSTFQNQDQFWYITYAKYLLGLGPSNVAGRSFVDYVYLQTPAVFYVLGLASIFWRWEPLEAAMPVLFACMALAGLLAAQLSQTVFRLPRAAAVAIGAILVSGPFFRYIAGNYFLSTLLATPVVVVLLMETIGERLDARRTLAAAAIRNAAAYALLLLFYPVLLFSGIALQGGVAGLAGLATVLSSEDRRAAAIDAARRSGRALVAIGVAAVAVFLLFRVQVIWAIDMARYLSRKGVAGWALDVISPLAMLGLPSHADRIAVSDPALRIGALALMVAVGLALAAVSLWPAPGRAMAAVRTTTGLTAVLFFAYVGYYLTQGASYQQWKFASYFPLPWSFVVLATALWAFLGSAPAGRWLTAPRSRRVLVSAGAAAAVALVGGNIATHAFLEPPLFRWPASLRNLRVIDSLPQVSELDVEMDNAGSTMLTAYFVRQKILHMVSQSYYASSPLAPDRISAERPYLRQGFGCEGVGHGDTRTIEGVGCLIFAPPSVTLETTYSFGRTFLPVIVGGMDRRESWGRWNRERVVRVAFQADVRRVPVDQDLYLNLRLSPYRPPGRPGQRLEFEWGTGRRAATALERQEWVSLPIHRDAWAGGPRLVECLVTVSLPDAVPLRDLQPGSTDPRPFAVRFEDASLTAAPRGRMVEPAGARHPMAADGRRDGPA